MIEIDNSFVDIDPNLVQQPISQLLLKKIKLLMLRRVAWLRHIWTTATEKNVDDFNIHHEIDGYLLDLDILKNEQEWYKTSSEFMSFQYSIDEIDAVLHQIPDSPILKLSKLFGLNNVEMEVIQLCFCQAIDPKLARVFAYMQDNATKNYVTEHLAAKLFGYSDSLGLKSDSPLKRWYLIREVSIQIGELPKLEIDPFIKNWLLSIADIDESIYNFASFQSATAPLTHWPLEKAIADINRILNTEIPTIKSLNTSRLNIDWHSMHPFKKQLNTHETENKIRVFIEAPLGSGHRNFAANICENLDIKLLAVNSSAINEQKWSFFYMLIQRQAYISNAAVIWYNEAIKEDVWPENIIPFPLQFVVDEGDCKPFDDTQFVNYRIQLPKMTYEERLEIWQKYVPQSESWPQAAFLEMVGSHETTIDKIVTIGKQNTPDITTTYELLRADSSQRLGSLTQLMPSTFIAEDLVLSDSLYNSIDDFIFEANERYKFWEQPNALRLFPQGKSLIGLFTGNPGTGKTMAAQVIANSLKLQLFRIDMSSVISKYIGESSKNIEKILNRAKNMNVVLFFDEADSLFGKRTDIKDSHDRYANTDTNYLLQAIENYPGIIILASNKASNIDSGFMRRFRFVLNFKEPDATQRLILWKKLIREMVNPETVDRLNGQLIQIAQHVEITGAQIKQAVLSSIFLSRKDRKVITANHILRGVERELIKQGKSLNKQGLQNLMA